VTDGIAAVAATVSARCRQTTTHTSLPIHRKKR